VVIANEAADLHTEPWVDFASILKGAARMHGELRQNHLVGVVHKQRIKHIRA